MPVGPERGAGIAMLGPRLQHWLDAFSTLFHPPHCDGCDAPVERRIWLCPDCVQRAEAFRLRRPQCTICSEPFDGEIGTAFDCPNCRDRRFRFVCAVSVVRARDVVREMLHHFKYEGRFHLRHPLAAWLAEAFDDPRLRQDPVDALVPVPLHPRRKRERGFNQAAELARLAAARRGLVVEELLRRTRYTSTQTRHDRRDRIENLRGAFAVARGARVTGRHLVLIDDVFTTGATVDECALVLRRAGAASVRVATVARG